MIVTAGKAENRDFLLAGADLRIPFSGRAA
jgi:hypothetical protein